LRRRLLHPVGRLRAMGAPIRQRPMQPSATVFIYLPNRQRIVFMIESNNRLGPHLDSARAPCLLDPIDESGCVPRGQPTKRGGHRGVRGERGGTAEARPGLCIPFGSTPSALRGSIPVCSLYVCLETASEDHGSNGTHPRIRRSYLRRPPPTASAGDNLVVGCWWPRVGGRWMFLRKKNRSISTG
jgi:hypothetical protein